MEESELQTHVDAIAGDGYTVLEDVFTQEKADAKYCRQNRAP